MAALYQIFDYPDAEENNSKLYDIVCQNLDHKVQAKLGFCRLLQKLFLVKSNVGFYRGSYDQQRNV